MRFLGREGLIVTESTKRRFVWDLPIRVLHWSLVTLIAISWWTANAGLMDWHRLSGLTIVALIIFRLLWGIFGSSTARFARFLKGPRALIAYMRPGDGEVRVLPPGHNPLGGWSVIALLAILFTQVTTGLFAVDIDGIESGPLSYLVDFDTGRLFSKLHDYSFNGLLALIGLHIGAIAFYLLVRRRNLILAMITGTERVTAGEAGFLVAAAVAAGIAYWIGGGAGG